MHPFQSKSSAQMGNNLKLLLPLHHLLFLCYVLSFEVHLTVGKESIFPGQFLSGKQTISSQNGRYELGFFTPGNSSNYYIGIWFKKFPVQTVVWVANRDNPLLDPFSSKLQLSQNGILLLFNESGSQVWSSVTPSNSVNSSVAVLEDSGNLFIRDGRDSSVIVWQSFDHPTDTWLPGAKLGLNKLTKERQIYFSWRNPDDPKPGSFSLELDLNGTRQYFIMQNGNRHWTCGIWPGRVSVFGPDTLASNYINMNYVSNEEENYFSYTVTNSSVVARYVMDSSGQLKQLIWDDYSQQWQLIWSRPKQPCEIYAFCGEYGGCNQFSFPTCRCLRGFQPKYPGEWNSGNHTHGCVRKSALQCSKGGKDIFLLISNIRLPANSKTLTVKTSEECEEACLRNCSCTGYTFDGECLIWEEDLLNIQYLSFGDNLRRDLHLRLATTELAALRVKKKERTYQIITGAAAVLVSLITISGLIVWRRKITKFSGVIKPTDDMLVPFNYGDLKSATKNFVEKLGEGGFGCVFRGTLPNSVAVAVKRLRCCGQGEKQFRAEVSIIGTIHHVNLVRLRGFCAEGMNRFLVYDQMPNGSLDSHLFRKDSKVLDWKTRYNIALGIARGLAYLHEECRDCVIHCDIKPENILLDAWYNPKISDFGLAKLLGRDFSRVLTTMKGTRGYLAPEWISGVAVTPKADVFSYGMLLFEIISGRRNWDAREDGPDDYFPGRAANNISNGIDVMSLLDCRLDGDGNADKDEVMKACKVACWCIQDEEKNRPSMRHVVQILEGLKEVSMPPVPRFIRALLSEEEDDCYSRTSETH